MKKLTIIFAIFFSAFFAKGQMVNPTTWTFYSKQNGNEVELIFKASIEKGWHLYDTHLPEGGPIATAFVFDDTTRFEILGDIQKTPEPVLVFDPTFQMNVGYFSDQAILIQKINLSSSEKVEISGYVLFMSCNDETCTPPEETPFSFTFNAGSNSGQAINAVDVGETGNTGFRFGQRTNVVVVYHHFGAGRFGSHFNSLRIPYDTHDRFIFYAGQR
jgi:thiol:disulfide interchange protein DsbD